MTADADLPRLEVQPLAQSHDRTASTCGVESLDAYLRTYASQDARRKANAVFVLVDPARPETIVGYFTLSAFGVDADEIPEAARRALPRSPRISATMIGRLAVDRSAQGRGLGRVLLARALRKACQAADADGSCMVAVHALGEPAARFYESRGFVRPPESLRLILPMASVGKIMGSQDDTPATRSPLPLARSA